MYRFFVPVLLVVYSTTNICGQRVEIPELSFYFDHRETVIPIAFECDKSEGVFGIDNGAFHINDVEGLCRCIPTGGDNSNKAQIYNFLPTIRSYCELEIEVIMRYEGVLELCASGGSDVIGCTSFGTDTEPGGDGINLKVFISEPRQLVLEAGYCGDVEFGKLTASIPFLPSGSNFELEIVGGTQEPTEHYYIDEVRVTGYEGFIIDPVIQSSQGDTLCAGEDVMILTAVAPDSDSYNWYKDGEDINYHEQTLQLSELVSLSDAGTYTVEAITAGGCRSSATYLVNVKECRPPKPLFSFINPYCPNETLMLSDSSEDGRVGSWNVSNVLDLSDRDTSFDIFFTDVSNYEYAYRIEMSESFFIPIDTLICPFDSMVINGNLYSLQSSLSGTEVLSTKDGCDSIVQINLQIRESVEINDILTICKGETLQYHNLVIDSNTPDGMVYLAGLTPCDTVLTYQVDVIEPVYDSIVVSLCEGQDTTINGEILNVEDHHYATQYLSSVQGCDSVLTIKVVETMTNMEYVNVEICDGDVFDTLGLSLSAEHQIDSFVNCGSSIIVEARIKPIAEHIISGTYCPDYEVIVNQNIYNSIRPNGLEVMRADNGCDSLVFVSLEFEEQFSKYIDGGRRFCPNEDTLIYGQLFNRNFSQATMTVSTASACDSIIHVDLQFIHTDTVLIEWSYCDADVDKYRGYSVGELASNPEIWAGEQYCDSLIIVNLTSGQKSIENRFISLCEGRDTSLYGITLSSENMMDTLYYTSKTGCDSLITFELILLEANDVSIVDDLCQNDTLYINGTAFHAGHLTGIEVLKNRNGCDSIVHVSLQIVDQKRTEVQYSLCPGESTTHDGITLSEEHTLDSTFHQSVSGCDSTTVIMVRFEEPLVPKITLDGELTCSRFGRTIEISGQSPEATLQWIGPEPMRVDEDSYIVTNAGRYGVSFVGEEICSDTSYIDIQFEELSVEFTASDVSCTDISNGSMEISALNNGILPLRLSGLFAEDTLIHELPTTIDSLRSGIYQLIWTDANGCQYAKELTIKKIVQVRTNFQITEVSMDQFSIHASSEVTLTDIHWKSDWPLNCENCESIIVSSVLPDDQPTVRFTAIDVNGCVIDTLIDIRSSQIPEISIQIYRPNVIRTSSTYGNSSFYPLGTVPLGYSYKMQIYDRWGNSVYKLNGATIGDDQSAWNGTSPDGQLANEGIYYYQITVLDTQDEKVSAYSGSFLLFH